MNKNTPVISEKVSVLLRECDSNVLDREGGRSCKQAIYMQHEN